METLRFCDDYEPAMDAAPATRGAGSTSSSAPDRNIRQTVLVVQQCLERFGSHFRATVAAVAGPDERWAMVAALDELKQAVDGVLHSLPPLPAGPLEAVVNGSASRSSKHSLLSAREGEMVELVAAGLTDAQIAERLFVSIRTVQSHLDRIRDKTGYRRRADLTRYAIQNGFDVSPAVRQPPTAINVNDHTTREASPC
jgi:DNA-binding CsgD family transcriptional regulator